MNNLTVKKMGLEYLTQEARELQRMFFDDEIDEETLKLQQNFNLEQIQNKASAIIELKLGTTSYINSVKERAKKMREFIKWLEEREKRFDKLITDCLVANGQPTGYTNGIYADNGILFLKKSACEIKIDLDMVDKKYKEHKIEGILTEEDMKILKSTLPVDLFEKIETKETRLNKDLWKLENGAIPKEHKFNVGIK